MRGFSRLAATFALCLMPLACKAGVENRLQPEAASPAKETSLRHAVQVAIPVAADATPSALQADASEQCGGQAQFVEVDARRFAVFECVERK